jgi:hypothetical protein
MEIDFPQINNDFTVFSKLFHVFYNKVEIINAGMVHIVVVLSAITV